MLSRDLAERVAALSAMPWFRLAPDDVLVATLVREALGDDALGRGFAHVPTSYELEGLWTPCDDDAAWHFNVHPEHAYDFHLADLAAAGRLRAINAYVDSPARPPKRLLFDSELAPDAMRRVAAHFAAEHGVMGIELGLAGCADGDDANAGGCAAVDAIVAKMRHAPADPGPQSRCEFALEGVLCCG